MTDALWVKNVLDRVFPKDGDSLPHIVCNEKLCRHTAFTASCVRIKTRFRTLTEVCRPETGNVWMVVGDQHSGTCSTVPRMCQVWVDRKVPIGSFWTSLKEMSHRCQLKELKEPTESDYPVSWADDRQRFPSRSRSRQDIVPDLYDGESILLLEPLDDGIKVTTILFIR